MEEAQPRARSLTVPSGSAAELEKARKSVRLRPRLLKILSLERRSSHSSYGTGSPISPGLPPNYTVHYERLWRPAFYFKVLSVLCAALYSQGVLASLTFLENCNRGQEMSFGVTREHHLSSAVFPYIVFSAFVIISSVTVLSYMLGHPMPDVINRAFSLAGGAMFLTAAGVGFHRWGMTCMDTGAAECSTEQSVLIMAGSCTALFTSVLHLADMVLNLRATLAEMEQPTAMLSTRHQALAKAAVSVSRSMSSGSRI